MVITRGRINRVRSALAVVAILGCAGCTSAGSGAPEDAWQVVTPPGIAAVSVAVAGEEVLIGGSNDGRPAVARLEHGSWQDLQVVPATAYGRQATLIHLAADPDGRIVAMGTATGGAHLNPRWTTWIGTTGSIVEEPQTVETFGGPNAGGITDVIAGDVPVVVGSWSLSAGAVGVAVWGHDGNTWVRRPSPPVLFGNSAAMTAATAAAAAGDVAVIAGLVTTFRQGSVHQQGAVWVSGPDRRTWTRVDLDTSEDNSAATDVSCSSGACLVVGRVGDRLAAWRLHGVLAARDDDLPDRMVDRFVAAPRVALRGSSAVIAGTGRDEVITSSAAGQWSSAAAPPGEVRRVAVAANRIYLLLRLADGAGMVVTRAY